MFSYWPAFRCTLFPASLYSLPTRGVTVVASMEKLVGAVTRPVKSLWRRASLINLRGGSKLTDDLSQPTVDATLNSTVGTKRRRDEEEKNQVIGEDGTLSKRPKLETKTTDQEVAPVLGEMALDGPPAQDFPPPSPVTGHQKASTGLNVRSPPKDKRKQRGLRGTRPEGQTNGPPKPRLGTKRQCAILIGFCGTGCSGMQM